LNESQELDEDDLAAPEVEQLQSSKIPPSSKGKLSGTPTKRSKKKKRKAAKGDTPGSQTPTETPSENVSDLDDVDRAIQEISQKYGDVPSPASQSSPAPVSRKYPLLSVQPKLLDADIELRKLFGKIVDVEAQEARRQPIHGIPARVVNRILKQSHAQRKSTLMKPKDEWQLFEAYEKRMLSMDIVEKEDGIIYFKFHHSRRYQDIQMQYFINVLGGDGNVLMALLQEDPFHVDAWYLSITGEN
jgi:Transcriptional repressor TCF25